MSDDPKPDDIPLTGGRWVIDLRRRIQVWRAGE
jgi:hypothetical protein